MLFQVLTGWAKGKNLWPKGVLLIRNCIAWLRSGSVVPGIGHSVARGSFWFMIF
jgi:hypothetical protein